MGWINSIYTASIINVTEDKNENLLKKLIISAKKSFYEDFGKLNIIHIYLNTLLKYFYKHYLKFMSSEYIRIFAKLLNLDILLNIMFHALMGRFQLELFIFLTIFPCMGHFLINTFKYHVSYTDGKISVRIIYFYYLFFHEWDIF